MVELIVFLGCFLPIAIFVVSVFACELRIQYRENDTRRYPRYGQSEEMRENRFKARSKHENQ